MATDRSASTANPPPTSTIPPGDRTSARSLPPRTGRCYTQCSPATRLPSPQNRTTGRTCSPHAPHLYIPGSTTPPATIPHGRQYPCSERPPSHRTTDYGSCHAPAPTHPPTHRTDTTDAHTPQASPPAPRPADPGNSPCPSNGSATPVYSHKNRSGPPHPYAHGPRSDCR